MKGENLIHAGQREQPGDSARGACNGKTSSRTKSLEAGDESAEARTVDEVDAAEIENNLILSGINALGKRVLEGRRLAGIDPFFRNPDHEDILA
jgi:hypothetical protein